jgi:DNA-binding NarL/FixJ family response regulator
MVRTIIVDDHQLVLAGLARLLATIEGIQVVGEATNGLDAVELAKSTRPHLALMDISMKGLNGIEATEALKAASPDTLVIIVSMHTAEEFVHRALRAGASGYVAKDCAPLELRLAVEAVMRGEIYLTPRISRQIVADLMRDQRHGSRGHGLDALTPRQREVMQLLIEGKTTKQVAHALGLSTKTVETHRGAIMQRLGLHTIAELVHFGIRQKIVPLDSEEE